MNDRQARYLFSAAAAWNFLAAAVALLAPDFHAASFFTPEAYSNAPMAASYAQGFWVFVLLFGVGYAVVARDPSKNHAIVALAAVGKTYVGVVWLLGAASGVLSALAVSGAVGDLAFAAVFAWFLYDRAKSAPSS